MGYDFEKQLFDGSNYELLPAQVIPEIKELVPGEVAYFDLDEMYVDHDSRLWINGYTHVWTLEEVVEDIADEEFNIARIICTEAGLIIDASHYDTSSYISLDKRFVRHSLDKIMNDPDEDFMPLPVIYFIGNKDELEIVTKPIEDWNITLVGSELDDIVGEYVIYMREEDDEDDE